MLLALAGLGGCAASGERPELNPSRWAPAAVQHEWQPGPGEQAIKLEAALEATPGGFDHNRPTHGAQPKYDLPALIDLALSRNPDTREAWAAARAAAAGWGISRAPFYPTVRVDSQNGYERIVDQVPKHWGTFKNWRSSDLLTVNYDLADFGRRDAAARSAREQLMAANLHFNRKIQEVVFAVEKNFYLLDAERANVAAAQAIVRLAITDRRAVEKSRVRRGWQPNPTCYWRSSAKRGPASSWKTRNSALATPRPTSRSHWAYASTALPEIEGFGGQAVPATLSGAVDRLIDLAMRERPDLAAKVAAVRSRDAAVDSGARFGLSDRRALRLLRQLCFQLSVVESAHAAVHGDGARVRRQRRASMGRVCRLRACELDRAGQSRARGLARRAISLPTRRRAARYGAPITLSRRRSESTSTRKRCWRPRSPPTIRISDRSIAGSRRSSICCRPSAIWPTPSTRWSGAGPTF